MSIKSVIFSTFIIAVATKCLVQGLQCYVCEDCNEYEDFKELHICGEIPIEATLLPGALENSATNKPAAEPTSKPMLPENSDELLDSEETHDGVSAVNTMEETTTNSLTTAATNTQSKTTIKPTTTTATVSAKPTVQKTETIQSSTLKETTSKITTASTTTSATEAAATTTIPNPELLPDYDDYLEYEDFNNAKRRSGKSLLKIDEPVCYMMKYQVNNTVLTNRGCTSFINANKYLTCQTLYNGVPMESCRICSSNGCNKFLSGESDEDNHGIPISAAGVMEKLGIVVLIIWVLINCSVF